MTFEEILDQAIAMLQRRGRLTYRTLQRQFQLDDAALEDLKDELIYGQRLAVDEDGRVLVWTGGADVSATTTLRTPQPEVSADCLYGFERFILQSLQRGHVKMTFEREGQRDHREGRSTSWLLCPPEQVLMGLGYAPLQDMLTPLRCRPILA